LETAVQCDLNHYGARINLGILLMEDPLRVGEAITHLEAAVRLRPEAAEAHFGLGLALLRTPGREREALPHFEEALRLRPDFPLAREMVDRGRATQR
jgi:tetratricopeptide (TPR) repeat protein